MITYNFKIKNPFIRSGTSLIIGFCSGFMNIVLPILSYRLKGLSREYIKSTAPSSSLLLRRIFDSSSEIELKRRSPTKIADIPILRNE
jgi:hypothetical protein